MSIRDKQKVKSRLTIVAFAIFGLFIGWISDASAFSSFFNSQGCNAAGCHDGTLPIATPTCNGCHAHGTHSDSNKNDLNVTATTDAATYSVGDTIAITVNGGYKTDWVRVNVYDENGTVIAQSKGTCDTTTSSGTACSNGLATPIILQVTAGATGTQMWTASWYGNENDASGSAGGVNGTQSTNFAEVGWLPDASNTAHGEEIVLIAAFTVNTAPTSTTSSGGGGSLGWPDLALLLFIVGMLAKDRRAQLIPVKLRKID